MSRRANYESLRVIQWFFLGLPILYSLYVAGGVLFSNTMRHDVIFFLTTFAEALGRPIGLCLLAFGIIHFYVLPRLNRALQRYGAVLTGTIGTPFAQPQPTASASMFTTPISVRTKLNWRWPLIIGISGLIIGCALLLNGIFGIRNAMVNEITGFVGFCLLFSLPLIFVTRPRFNIQPRITMTAADQYLLVTFDGANFTVQWSEARLFSVIGKREERPMVLRYALQGNGMTAEWWMYTRPPRWFDVARLDMSYEEYDRRMREILSVVSAKTGLSLLDLR